MEQMKLKRKLVQDEVKLVYNIEDSQEKVQNAIGKRYKTNRIHPNQSTGKVSGKFNKSNSNGKNINYINDCNRCGKLHKVRECPA